jgi:hypothetical protein
MYKTNSDRTSGRRGWEAAAEGGDHESEYEYEHEYEYEYE